MVAEFMVQPSSWIEQGITIQTVRGLRLYRAHLKSFDDYGMMIEDVKSKENELLKQSDRYRMGNPRTAVARGATSEEKNSTAGLELSSAD